MSGSGKSRCTTTLVVNHNDVISPNFSLSSGSHGRYHQRSTPLNRSWRNWRNYMELESNLSPRILIAVDDPDLRRASVAGLRAAGFCVSAPTDGDAALMLAEKLNRLPPRVEIIGVEGRFGSDLATAEDLPASLLLAIRKVDRSAIVIDHAHRPGCWVLDDDDDTPESPKGPTP